MSSEILEMIRKNGEIVTEFLKRNHAPSGYSLEALQWLEAYLDEQRPSLDEQSIRNLVNTIGSFLGECFCRNYNGTWVNIEGQWGVQIEGADIKVFPFNKVHKFLENDVTDSFVSMYRTLPALIEHFKQKNSGNTTS